MFIVSLATADLTVGIVVMPISAVYIFSVRWPFGLAVCQFWLAVDYTASTASILNLLVLSIDRYRSVTDPLRYMRRRTARHAGALIAAAWSLSALWLLPIVAWHWMFAGGRRTVPPGMTTLPSPRPHICSSRPHPKPSLALFTPGIFFLGGEGRLKA